MSRPRATDEPCSADVAALEHRPPASAPPSSRRLLKPLVGRFQSISNVPKSWVGEAARQGRLPCIMLGRYRRFDRADLLAWLKEQKGGGGRRRTGAA